jgi:actin-related protein
MDELEVIVIDNGSQTIKAGYSGEDAPRSVFPSMLGQIADREAYRGQEIKDCYVGSEAQEHREMLALSYPIQRGVVTDWDAMEKLWDYTFTNELHVSPEASNMPVLLTDAPLNPKVNRERMAQIMFENFKVSGFYIATQAVLSLYASGRTRGIVVESGADVTHAVPIFEGYALPHAILRLDMGGKDVSEYLRKKLATKGPQYVFSHNQMDIVRDIKEKLCYVAPVSYEEEKARQQSEKPYELPDGVVIGIDREARTSCAETLFQPSLLNDFGGDDHLASASKGIADLCFESIQKCDKDLQKDLFSSVVLAGGTSMLPGFAERMNNEIIHKASSADCALLAPRVRIVPDLQGRERGYNSQRKHAAWIGGSMFASLPTFGQIEITKQEWEDCHESIVHRKCF